MTYRRSFDPAGVWFGVTIPLVVAVLGLVLTATWRDRLPPRIVTHWSAHGPDGYGTPMSAAWTFALIIVLVGGGLAAPATLAQALLLMRRTMLILGLTVTGVLFATQLAMLLTQLDHTGVAAPRFPAGAIPAGALAGFAVGVVAATRLHDFRERRTVAARPPANLPRLARPEPITDTVGFSRGGTAVFVVIVVAAVIAGCAAARATWPIAAAVVVVAVVAGLMRFQVTVDATGVRVRNLGLLSLDVDLAEIAGAEVITVRPFGDFGGWGLRRREHGQYGIVTRTGPAVRVDTASGLTLTITTDRAEAMAASLNTWADQARGG